MRTHRQAVIGLAVGVGALLGIAHGAQATTFFAGTVFEDFSSTPAQATTGSANASESYSEDSGGIAFLGSATSAVSTGGISFHMLSSLSGTDSSTTPPFQTFIDSSSIAGIADTITVNNPSLTGMEGAIAISFGYNGTVGSSGGAYSFANGYGVACNEGYDINLCIDATALQTNELLGIIGPEAAVESGSGVAAIGEIPFIYGTPLNISIYLVGNASEYPAYGSSVNVYTDFADTAYLEPFAVYSNGMLDKAATITSDTGGLAYLVAVPEPATWATTMMGLFGVGAVLRGRRKLRDGATAA